MTDYRFSVGETVRVKALPRNEPVQAFRVVRLMPVDEAGVPQYRIKGLATGLERAVREVELEPAEVWPSGGRRY